MAVKGKRGGRGLDWELGISSCKLVYTERINHHTVLNNEKSPKLNEVLANINQPRNQSDG